MTEWVGSAVLAVLVFVPVVKARHGHKVARQRQTEEWISYLQEDLVVTR